MMLKSIKEGIEAEYSLTHDHELGSKIEDTGVRNPVPAVEGDRGQYL
jgi:hypothetical protein